MFAITGITGKLPDTNSIVRRGLPRVAAIAMSLVALEASSQPTNQPSDQKRSGIMTMKDDLANRSTGAAASMRPKAIHNFFMMRSFQSR
jgi:hypothetical protein